MNMLMNGLGEGHVNLSAASLSAFPADCTKTNLRVGLLAQGNLPLLEVTVDFTS